ncbi:MAG: hypothetical protein EBU90_20570 [Proteobacteria bacterium]|nr:hypothetical protein [Pseudomonadota bacterium]NBP16170.1 hypothetical protein [bacterium]
MKPMPNIWLDTITSFDQAISQIESCIILLKDNAETSNFFEQETKEQYKRDLTYMKQLFEKAETLSRNS